MANFCGKCGAPINPATGLCPNCDIIPQPVQSDNIRTIIADEDVIPSEVMPAAAVEDAHDTPVMQPSVENYEIPQPMYAEPVAPQVDYSQPVYTEPAPQPVYPQYQSAAQYPAEAPQQVKQKKAKEPKKPKKQRKQMNKVLSCILIILLCLLTFITTLYPALGFTIRSATTEESINEIANEIEVVDVLKELPVSEDVKNTSDAENYAELICEYVDVNIADSTDKYRSEISIRHLKKFEEKSEIKSFAADLISEYINDFYAGSAKFKITSDDVKEFIEDNESSFASSFGISEHDLYKVTSNNESQVEAFSKWLVKDSDVKKFRPAQIKRDMPAVYNGVHYGLSYPIMICSLVLTAGLIVLMVLCNWKQTLYAVGITFTLLGAALTTVALIAADVLVPIFTELSVVSVVVKALFAKGLPIFLIILALGILVLFGGIMVSVITKKKAK